MRLLDWQEAGGVQLWRRLLALLDIPDRDRGRIASNRDICVPAMIEAASSYPSELVGTLVANARLVAGARDAEITVSLLAGPDQAATEQTLNSFLHCCTDLSQVGRFLVLYVGMSALPFWSPQGRARLRERAMLRERYGFVEIVDCGDAEGPGAQLARPRKQIGGRFWLHLGQGWQFFAPENLITRLTGVLDAEPQVFQVGINFADAVKPTSASAAEEAVRRTPDGGRYVLADGVASGAAMFDTARLDQVGGVDGADPDPLAALGRRAAAAGMGTASLDQVFCQRSKARAATTVAEVVSPSTSCSSRTIHRFARLILAGHSNLGAIAGRDVFSGPLEVIAAHAGTARLLCRARSRGT